MCPITLTVEEAGFLRRENQPYYLANFSPENCMKIKEIGAKALDVDGAPPHLLIVNASSFLRETFL